MLSTYSFSQTEITIKGKVVDDLAGEAMIGANVHIKGTSIGTATDVDGSFELKTTQAPPFTIVVGTSGYLDKEIEFYEETDPIEIRLRISKTLEEVVVVGYGEQKRRDITGSVSSIPTELKTQPVGSVERLLQGAVAGAVVTQTSGQPGGGVSVQIRGSNSITAGSDPLYVIDGFPINNDIEITDAGVTDRNGIRLNPLSTISTSDIESIDVLKDASATAIYGSRGANGVVIVTTKKGLKNKSSINYDAYYGVQNVVRKIPVLTGAEWWQLRKEATLNTPGGKAPTLPVPTGFDYDTTGAGTDWQGAAFRQAPIQSHTLSFLSGTDKTRVALSGNYFNQEGVLLNTGFKRFSGRLNLDHELSQRFKLSSYLTASNSHIDVAPQAVVFNLLMTSPAIPVYDNAGNFVKNTSTDSPLQNPINSLLNQTNESKTFRFLGNVAGEYKIIDGLTAKVLVGSDVVFNKQNRYLPNSTYEGNNTGGIGTGGIATIGSVFTTNWLNENTLNFSRIINKKHSINAVAGFTAQASDSKYYIASAGVFAFDELTYNALQNGTGARAPSSNSIQWQLASYLGRVNYVLNEKYLFTATFRTDGSSRFGANHKWGFFPSAAVGWNVNRENFLKDFRVLSDLKLRASAGNTGNQSIPPYSSLSQIAPYRYSFSNTTVQGYAPLNAANPNLTWEKTFQLDFGVDFGLLDNRIHLTADYYDKKTTDLLLSATVPGTSGWSFYDPTTNISLASTVYQNLGAVQNRGVELALNTRNFESKKFSWNTTFIFSKNANKILDLGGPERIIPDTRLPSVLQVGAPVGSFYVYQTDGLIQPGEQGPNALTPQANKTVGGQKYKDIDGDGKITQAGDRVLIKNQPGVNFGFTNTFSYKSPVGTFDLTAFFQSTLGAKLYNNNRAWLELGTGFYNGSKDMLDRYSASNTDTDVKEAYQDPAITLSDRYIEDASYVRLKNLTLGFTLPESWTSKARFKTVRIYGSLQNYATWTKYKGYDPEANVNGQSLIYRGLDNGVYPNAKTALLGVNLTF